MLHFFDSTADDLADWCVQHDMPAYAAQQVLEWVYQKGVVDSAAMTNLSQTSRSLIAGHIRFYAGTVIRHQIATDATQKLLVDWTMAEVAGHADSDSREVGALKLVQLPGDPSKQTECVMIPTEQRKTACVSSQIGCPVGCKFCASGIGGMDGNLRAGQIVEQVHRLQGLAGVGRITNVVFMGMGEPLANFANVTRAIRILNNAPPFGMGISARKITVSTVGLPAAIRKLVAFEVPVTLALSLHAPNDDLRRTLIPWANYATIDELLDACDEYFAKTGREITLEYLLLRGVNDRIEHARELASLCKRLRANVNLIRYNEVKGLPFDRPTASDVRAFQEELRGRGVNAHVRASRGRDIAAACGQLRHEHRQAASPMSSSENAPPLVRAAPPPTGGEHNSWHS
jgi:23S rRNA (adenine2503-C2)-methyltransferase